MKNGLVNYFSRPFFRGEGRYANYKIVESYIPDSTDRVYNRKYWHSGILDSIFIKQTEQ